MVFMRSTAHAACVPGSREGTCPSVRGVGLRQRFMQWLKRGKPGVLVKPGWEGESKMAVHSNVLRYLFWQIGVARL